MPSTPPTLLNVVFHNTEELLYQGPALAVSCVNEHGSFDILPFHTNFIALVTEHIRIHLPDGGESEFLINKGIIKIYDNNITICTGFETLA